MEIVIYVLWLVIIFTVLSFMGNVQKHLMTIIEKQEEQNKLLSELNKKLEYERLNE
ncbi:MULTISPECIES: hypothetical protein [Bacillaceae]|uniref:hypothetical protein n=1 Tax=Bacillaceae TaxID=186817 RepID=UPI001BDF7085|nr:MULTISPECIES: hypothetical protein [Bacillaceae]MDX8360234.1 hypothetical protein [Cytobacillus sp. IB215316]